MTPQVQTYQDVLAAVTSFAQARGAGCSQTTIRYAIEAAYREIISARDWNCLRKIHRVQLKATQKTGTCSYFATGGAYDHLCTLSGAILPDWAIDAQVRLGSYSTVCDIDAIISETEFTLRPPRVPADTAIAAGAYALGRSWYDLPADFVAAYPFTERSARFIGQYIPFETWHQQERYNSASGNAQYWTVGPVADLYGVTALYVHPWSSTNAECDLIIKTRPRTLAISGNDPWNYAGTVSVPANSLTVTGSSTTFRDSMVGSLIRFSSGSTRPTGTNGENPYLFQQSIMAVDTTAQTLTMGAAATVALSGVKYLVTDPVDFNLVLYDAFLRNCEKQLAYASGMKDAEAVARRYQAALSQARAADAPIRGIESRGQNRHIRTRLADTYIRTEAG